MNTPSQHIDCRGQQCPQPILTTAKAARALRNQGGGVIEIDADDDAFPLDIRSWCRSSGSELVGVTSADNGTHRAIVRIPALGGTQPQVPAAPPVKVEAAVDVLDCRGMQCPQPILEVARRARTLGSGHFEVVADDPAFKLDLSSWGRSSGSEIQWVETGATLRARVELKGKNTTAGRAAPAPTPVPRPPAAAARPPAVARPTPPQMPAAHGDTEEPGLDISLTNLDDSQRLARLQAIGASLTPGELVRIRCQGTSFTTPLLRWASEAGHEVLTFDARSDTLMELRASSSPAVPSTVMSSKALEVIQTENRCTLLVLHNDKEALLAALLVANGAAAQGMEVVLFFTFWGLNLLRGDEPNTTMPKENVSWMQKMMKWMMPKGPRRQKLGQMDMGGVGRGMLKSIMDSHNIMDIPELLDAAEEQDIRFIACTMSMQVMGITKRDLAPRKNIEYGGVAAFVESAGKSSLSLMF